MTAVVPKVYRGSVRPITWSLYSDYDALTPLVLPDDAIAFLTITRWGETISKRSDEAGLMLFVGHAISPATVRWTPTLDESRTFVGRVHVELEYQSALAGQMPLLLPHSSLDFVNGKNADDDA